MWHVLLMCEDAVLISCAAGENPAELGFKKFDEKRFSRHVRLYQYCERNLCWLWDIVDSIDDTVTYPYCDKLLHWLKGVGYKRYSQRAKRAFLCENAPPDSPIPPLREGDLLETDGEEAVM